MTSNKKYGLIMPDKTKPQLTFQASRNVFGNDSDSEDESRKKPVLLRPSDNINRQAKVTQEKALLEDPTVYQYDEVYEIMANKKEEKTKNKEEKKPRYIENLLKSANRRKIENERRLERQIQKEREKEGDEFADKEVFVTSAYKKKLEEMSLEEEREKREEYLESIGDVRKQKDLGGFYRHLYEQKLGSEKNVDLEEKLNLNPTEKAEVKVSCSKNDNNSADILDNSKKRNYRKRKSSSDVKKSLSEGEIEDSDDEINHVNLNDLRLAKKSKKDDNVDADSDFSIDESSEDEGIENDGKKLKENQKIHISSKSEHVQHETNSKKEVSKKDENILTETKPKIDIWKKRTVGEVFEDALKRYYMRKAARGM